MHLRLLPVVRALAVGLAAAQFPTAAALVTDTLPVLAERGPAAPLPDLDTDAAVTSPRPATLSTLVAETISDDPASRDAAERNCLARAVFFEARGEPLEGQLAVAQVVLNRAASRRYADSICGVITQPGQFSFDANRQPADSRDWRVAKAIAAIAERAVWSSPMARATAFHAIRVAVSWSDKQRLGTIGNHIFYR